MKIYIGADHRGFPLKETLKAYLATKNYELVDLGASQLEPQDDFVDFAKLVAVKVASDSESFGILLCGSGAGMCIAANKVVGISCAVGHSPQEIQAARHDDNINVLSLPADYVSVEQAKAIIDTFLTTAFASQDRFLRRIAKIKELETNA